MGANGHPVAPTGGKWAWRPFFSPMSTVHYSWHWCQLHKAQDCRTCWTVVARPKPRGKQWKRRGTTTQCAKLLLLVATPLCWWVGGKLWVNKEKFPQILGREELEMLCRACRCRCAHRGSCTWMCTLWICTLCMLYLGVYMCIWVGNYWIMKCSLLSTMNRDWVKYTLYSVQFE